MVVSYSMNNSIKGHFLYLTTSISILFSKSTTITAIHKYQKYYVPIYFVILRSAPMLCTNTNKRFNQSVASE